METNITLRYEFIVDEVKRMFSDGLASYDKTPGSTDVLPYYLAVMLESQLLIIIGEYLADIDIKENGKSGVKTATDVLADSYIKRKRFMEAHSGN